MPPRPYLTAAAERDLEQIWWWIARSSGAARADSVVDRISACMDRLAAAPQTGRRRPELGAERRSFADRPYLILCHLTEKTITVDRVVDGRRDLAHLLAVPGDPSRR